MADCQSDYDSDKREQGQCEKRACETLRPAPNNSNKVRSGKSSEVADGIDQRDAGGSACAAEKVRGHCPERTQRSPDPDSGKSKRCKFGAGNLQECCGGQPGGPANGADRHVPATFVV